MTRIYSDDEYADALADQKWNRYSKSVAAAFERYIAEVEAQNPGTFTPLPDYELCGDFTPNVKNGVSHSYDGNARAQHRNHVHHEVYGPGAYVGGAGTEGG